MLTSIPTWIQTAFTLAGAIGGILTIVNLVNNDWRMRRREFDSLEESIRVSYKEKVEFLEKEVKELKDQSQRRSDSSRKDIAELRQQMVLLSAEKNNALNILQGRDEEAIEIKKGALKAIPMATEAITIMKSNNNLLQELSKTMNTHIIQHNKDMEKIFASSTNK